MELAQLILIFLVGASIGSFLNVCITRWPKQLSVVRPRSRCPRCERPIEWYENIPILSWLLLRGKCRGCALPISALYPIIELSTAVGWTLAFLYLGFTFTALRVAIFGTVLLGIAVTDARDYIIPDGFTITGFLWNFAAAMIAAVMGGDALFAPFWREALFGGCVGAGSVAIVGWLGEAVSKKEAMGFGDVTLMAMAGVALGPERALVALFLGALLGSAVFILFVYPILWLRSRRSGSKFHKELVPFGVFLAPASLIVLLWGDQLRAWYEAIVRAPGN